MTVLQQYAVTRNGTVAIASFPRFTITAQVYDNAGTLLADFTGANALSFPAVVKTLLAGHPELVDEFTQLVAQWIVQKSAGV